VNQGGNPDPGWEDLTALFFNIPTGMSIVSVTGFENCDYDYDADDMELLETGWSDPATKEYKLLTPAGISLLTPNDTIKFDIVFHVNENALCDVYKLYVEMIYEDERYCDIEDKMCDFGEVLAGSYPELVIDLYVILPYVETGTDFMDWHGVMYPDDSWGGTYRAITHSYIKPYDTITVLFYADMNHNGKYDEGIDLPMDTINYPTGLHQPGDLLPIYLDTTIVLPGGTWEIPTMSTIDGYGLLAHLADDYMCEGFFTPIATLFGPKDICAGDTTYFYTAQDMLEYDFSTETGAAISQRLPLPGDMTWSSTDWQARFVYNIPGEYTIAIRYRTPEGEMAGLWTNRTFKTFTVHQKPVVGHTSNADTTVCIGTQIELGHFFEDITEQEATIKIYKKIADGTDIYLGTPDNGDVFDIPYETTIYYAIAETQFCETIDSLELEVIVIPMLQAWATVQTQPTCGYDNGVLSITVTGGSGLYEFSYDGIAYEPLPLDGILDNMAAGVYTIYVQDILDPICDASITEPVVLSPAEGPTIVATATQASDCDAEDATITLVVNGGNAPYQYSLDNGDIYDFIPTTGIIGNGFGAGKFDILVMDNDSCIAATYIIVDAAEGDGLVVTIDLKTDADCDAKGRASISVSGGTEPYYYRLPGEGWIELIEDEIALNAGEHLIYVKDANGCETHSTVTIHNTENLSAVVTLVDIECQGAALGSISVSVTGTSPMYDYSVNSGFITGQSYYNEFSIIGLQAGKYQLVITNDNDCTYTIDDIEIGADYEYLKANNDLVYTFINMEVSGYVLYNDFDINDRIITILDRDYEPENGTISLYTENGAFTYIPDVNFVGKDSVMYFIENSCGMRDSAWIIIIVLDRGHYPVFAFDDYYTTNVNETLFAPYSILLNDYASGPHTLETPTMISNVSNGTLTLNADGTFTYVPNYGFIGVDQFIYQICNEIDTCATAHVFITVLPDTYLEDHIIANNDAYIGIKNETLVIGTIAQGVMGNDVYECSFPFTTLLDDVQHGVLFFNNDGTFEYTPEEDYVGPDGFTYVLCCDDEEFVACDTAFAFIMVIETDCPLLPVLVLDTGSICAGSSIDLHSLVLESSRNIDTVFFYATNEYLTPLASTIVSVQGSYYLRAFNIYDCYVDSSVYVKVNPLPTVSTTVIGKDTAVCSNRPVEFDLSQMIFTDGEDVLYSIFIDFSYLILERDAHEVPPGDSSMVYVRAFNTSTGCLTHIDNIDSVHIRVVRTPNVTTIVAGKDTLVCSNNTETFDLTSMAETDVNEFELIFSLDRDFATTIPDSNAYHVGPDESVLVYIRACNTVTGCFTDLDDIDSVRIIVAPVPAVDVLIANKDTMVCSNQSVEFDLSLMVVTSGDSLQFSTSTDFVSLIDDIYAYSVNSGATIKLYVRAMFKETECTTTEAGIDSVTLRVNPYAEETQITITGETEICGNTSTQLTASATGITSPIFRWYETETSTDILHTGATFTTPVLLRDSTFYVSVSGYGYCESLERKPVEINITTFAPTIVITADKTEPVCEGTAVTFTATITYGGDAPEYQWKVNGVEIENAINSTFTYTPEDGDVVTCVLISDSECANSNFVTSNAITMSVVEMPSIPTLLTISLPALPGMPVNLMNAVQVIPGLTYTFYENPDGTGRINGSIVIYTPPKDDYYVSASNGSCESPLRMIGLHYPCPYFAYDDEGNEYKVTALAGFCWTENMKNTKYIETENLIAFAQPYYSPLYPDVDLHKEIFGLLYTWYSAVGLPEGSTETLTGEVRGICPVGWRIPSQAEWAVLNQFSAQQLMSEQYWFIPGTDDFGFDSRPAGQFNSITNRFEDLYGYTGYWASDAEPGARTATSFYFTYYCNTIQEIVKLKADALSVRCIITWE
jgi:uncharacterized protein (TIGR02145 family)